MIFLMKMYLIVFIVIIMLYMFRHYYFSYNRVFGKQKIDYHDIIDSDLPSLTVLLPMHNEEKVAKDILNALINSQYPKDKMEIIVINDHSEDQTSDIINYYARIHNYIKIIERNGDLPRGKTYSLNEALTVAKGSIIVVYDADYIPSKGNLRNLAINFKDPKVGAVMGRVVPINTGSNLLTRLIDLERSAGYQIDQQARYNLNLIPLYGGTVGAFRKDVVLQLGGFDNKILAEDTDLTFNLFTNGYKVIYSNEAECYEESPETWESRGQQISRWSKGHNQVLFKYLFKVLKSKNLSFWQKVDGSLLLFIYLIPFLMLLGYADCLILFFLGEMSILSGSIAILSVFLYNTFGNFATFFEIGLASFLDGSKDRIKLITLFYFVFVFNIFYASAGFIDCILKRDPIKWRKTKRHRELRS